MPKFDPKIPKSIHGVTIFLWWKSVIEDRDIWSEDGNEIIDSFHPFEELNERILALPYVQAYEDAMGSRRAQIVEVITIEGERSLKRLQEIERELFDIFRECGFTVDESMYE